MADEERFLWLKMTLPAPVSIFREVSEVLKRHDMKAWAYSDKDVMVIRPLLGSQFAEERALELLRGYTKGMTMHDGHPLAEVARLLEDALAARTS